MMQITDTTYYSDYEKEIGNSIPLLVEQYDFSEGKGSLGYKVQASAVYSSNIEGNSIDLNTFMNYKVLQQKLREPKEIEEIENLIAAYQFAQNNLLTEKNFLACHNLLSKTLVIKSKQGKYRTDRVGVFSESGLVYLAVEPEFVAQTMKALFTEIETLLKTQLTLEQLFYHAALIHLRLAHIHPFQDGNGRVARLLEKWFIAEKAGKPFWNMQSEKYYKNNQQQYYTNINLGVNFYELDYGKCMSFLKMLPHCLEG